MADVALLDVEDATQSDLRGVHRGSGVVGAGERLRGVCRPDRLAPAQIETGFGDRTASRVLVSEEAAAATLLLFFAFMLSVQGRYGSTLLPSGTV